MAYGENKGLSAKAAEAMGLPEGFKTFTPFPFGGMDQQSSRQGIKDNEFFYLENFLRIGDADLRTLWDVGDSIYTAAAGKTIVSFFFFNIGATNYAAVFLDDGTAIQVNPVTGATVTISSTANTFYVTDSPLPACRQWGTLYLIIANNITSNSYWLWDGAILYSPGSLGPAVTIDSGGSGYSSAPTVTIFGGSGSGAVATAVVSNGAVVLVNILDPGTGYLPGETVQFIFTGGGSDTSARLTAVLSTGVVDSVQIVSGGTGYTAGTYALGFAGGGGSGAAGTYTVDATLKVISTALTSGGSGYTGTPTVSFPSGGGAGATGVALLTPGAVASVTVVNGGGLYDTTPTLTFVGGGGDGATATAVLTAKVITSVTITNGGSGYTSVPAVVVQPGASGVASATATLMPYGVSGSSIETYKQRVWLPFPNQTGNQQNGGTFLVSAPGSLTDFSTSDGGLIFTSTDSFLRYQYTNIRQSNGYLYPIGDSSVDVISNVQTTGILSTTTFNYQNTDPQIGTSWRDTCVDYGRTILFANPLGVYGIYGGAITKISSKIDKLFTNAAFPTAGGVTPCSAVANIFSQKIFIMLMTITDVLTGMPRNVLIGWNEEKRDWFVASQSITLTYIGSQEVNSDITAWGTDGSSLFPLFSAPSSDLIKIIATKLYGAQSGFMMKQILSVYVQAQDLTTTGTGVEFSSGVVDNEIGFFTMPNTISFPAVSPSVPKTSPLFATQSGDVVGINLGVTLSSTSPDFSLSNLIIGYKDTVGIFGSTDLTGYVGE